MKILFLTLGLVSFLFASNAFAKDPICSQTDLQEARKTYCGSNLIKMEQFLNTKKIQFDKAWREHESIARKYNSLKRDDPERGMLESDKRSKFKDVQQLDIEYRLLSNNYERREKACESKTLDEFKKIYSCN